MEWSLVTEVLKALCQTKHGESEVSVRTQDLVDVAPCTVSWSSSMGQDLRSFKLLMRSLQIKVA